jgi:hypothetical protein
MDSWEGELTMNDSDKTTQHLDSAVLRFWQRIPVLIQAIVLGFTVSLAGVFAWQVILVLIPATWSFVVFHLNQAWAPPVLFHLFAVAVLWGLLAYTSGSLLPGIISHTVADIFNFSYWWTDVAGTFDKRPIAETGLDSHFVVWTLIFVASVALFAWAARKTLAARRPR